MSTMASSSFDPAAVAHSRHLPMESAMPGTTLQLIPLSTFSGNGALYGEPSALSAPASRFGVPLGCSPAAAAAWCMVRVMHMLRLWLSMPCVYVGTQQRDAWVMYSIL